MTVNEMIMSKDSERKMELCTIRARANRKRNKKIKLYAKGFAKTMALGILGYVCVVGLYVIH